jgi:hypothetical protein
MWILQLEDTISNEPGPTITDANPLEVELDSTDPTPDPTLPIKVYLSLEAPNISNDAVVSFEGTTANFWSLTKDDPTIVSSPVWVKETTMDVRHDIHTAFWIRATTVFEEVPRDDRTVGIKVTGKVEKE